MDSVGTLNSVEDAIDMPEHHMKKNVMAKKMTIENKILVQEKVMDPSRNQEDVRRISKNYNIKDY